MTNSSSYKTYELHYQRMLNSVPLWHCCPADLRSFSAKAWLPQDKKAKILDFGCGYGQLLWRLWWAGYEHSEGVELVSELAAQAQQAAADRLRIHAADGREFLRNASATYQLIILSDVLEHFPVNDGLELLKIVWQALSPGGTVVVRVPNASYLGASFGRYLDVTHYVSFTEYSLLQLLDLASFTGHQFVKEDLTICWREWRPWRPWKKLALRPRLNQLLHRFVFWLQGINPAPTIFSYNLEAYSCRPK